MKRITNVIRQLLSMYGFAYARFLAQLCNRCNYQPKNYLVAYWRTQDFRLKKQSLNKSNAIEGVVGIGMYLQIIAGLLCTYYGYAEKLYEYIYFGVAIIIAAPVVWAHVVALLLALRLFGRRITADLQS